jgi:hypothetical protein
MTEPNIFISHSSADKLWCRGFTDALRSSGYDAWYDELGLSGGATWIATIERELHGRELIVVILTPEAWSSTWVQDEIRLAEALRRRTVVLVHTPTPVADAFIAAHPHLDVCGQSDREACARFVEQLGAGGLDGDYSALPSAEQRERAIRAYTSVPVFGPRRLLWVRPRNRMVEFHALQAQTLQVTGLALAAVPTVAVVVAFAAIAESIPPSTDQTLLAILLIFAAMLLLSAYAGVLFLLWIVLFFAVRSARTSLRLDSQQGLPLFGGIAGLRLHRRNKRSALHPQVTAQQVPSSALARAGSVSVARPPRPARPIAATAVPHARRRRQANILPRLFVSGVSDDDDGNWYRDFADALRAYGYDVWLDYRGDDDRTAARELMSCDVFVPIITADALGTGPMRDRIQIATASNRLILPAVRVSTPLEGILLTRQWLDVAGQSGVEAAGRCVTALRQAAADAAMSRPPTVGEIELAVQAYSGNIVAVGALRQKLSMAPASQFVRLHAMHAYLLGRRMRNIILMPLALIAIGGGLFAIALPLGHGVIGRVLDVISAVILIPACMALFASPIVGWITYMLFVSSRRSARAGRPVGETAGRRAAAKLANMEAQAARRMREEARVPVRF